MQEIKRLSDELRGKGRLQFRDIRVLRVTIRSVAYMICLCEMMHE